MKLVQYNEYLVSIMDTDGLVLLHQGISSRGADYVPMRFPVFKGFINSSKPNDSYLHKQTRPSLVQIMACHLFGAKPLSKPMLAYCELNPWNIFQWNLNQDTMIFIEENDFENVCKMAAILWWSYCVKDCPDDRPLCLHWQ